MIKKPAKQPTSKPQRAEVFVDVRLTDNRSRAAFTTSAKAKTPERSAQLAAAKYFGCDADEVELDVTNPGNQASRRPRLYRALLKSDKSRP